MPTNTAYLTAELREWPSMDQMVSILGAGGLQISVSRYSIRLNGFSHFVFAEYGGDISEPSIAADASSPEELAADAQRVSSVLSRAGVIHRFEIYSESGVAITYITTGLNPSKPCATNSSVTQPRIKESRWDLQSE